MKRKFQAPRRLGESSRDGNDHANKKPKTISGFRKSSTILQPSTSISTTTTHANNTIAIQQNSENQSTENYSTTQPTTTTTPIVNKKSKYYSAMYKHGKSSSKKPWQDGVLIIQQQFSMLTTTTTRNNHCSTRVILRTENYNYKKELANMSGHVLCLKNNKSSNKNSTRKKKKEEDESDESDESEESDDNEEDNIVIHQDLSLSVPNGEFQMFVNDMCTGVAFSVELGDEITEYKWMKKMKEDVSLAQLAKEIPSTNIGHRLLVKMGWKPGESLNSSSSDTKQNDNRAGVAADSIMNLKIKTDRAGIGYE